MPAIEFARLRTKIELLGKVYDSPEKFMHDLTEFYSFYADLTFQEFQKVNRVSQPAYHTPAVLTRELEHAFIPNSRSNPEATLQIIDLLWKTGFLEPRQFASSLMGALPISYYSQVLERIQNWSFSSSIDEELVSTLHTKATVTLRKERSDLWIKTLNQWIQTSDLNLQKMAVLGLLPFLNDPDFMNLPIIFNFLTPLMFTMNPHLNLPMMSIFEKLVQKSETETLYFVKHMIRSSDQPTTARFIRRILPHFSESAQSSIKTYLRDRTTNKP